MVYYDVQVEPALQPITGEQLARRTNQAPDARLDVHCRGFWERQSAASVSYTHLTLPTIYSV